MANRWNVYELIHQYQGEPLLFVGDCKATWPQQNYLCYNWNRQRPFNAHSLLLYDFINDNEFYVCLHEQTRAFRAFYQRHFKIRGFQGSLVSNARIFREWGIYVRELNITGNLTTGLGQGCSGLAINVTWKIRGFRGSLVSNSKISGNRKFMYKNWISPGIWQDFPSFLLASLARSGVSEGAWFQTPGERGIYVWELNSIDLSTWPG